MFYLENEGRGPDDDKHATAMKTGEDVRRAVDLACVDLVEQRHHDEHVEHERVMLCRSAQVFVVSSAVDVQKLVTCIAIGMTIYRLPQRTATGHNRNPNSNRNSNPNSNPSWRFGLVVTRWLRST